MAKAGNSFVERVARRLFDASPDNEEFLRLAESIEDEYHSTLSQFIQFTRETFTMESDISMEDFYRKGMIFNQKLNILENLGAELHLKSDNEAEDQEGFTFD